MSIAVSNITYYSTFIRETIPNVVLLTVKLECIAIYRTLINIHEFMH